MGRERELKTEIPRKHIDNQYARKTHILILFSKNSGYKRSPWEALVYNITVLPKFLGYTPSNFPQKQNKQGFANYNSYIEKALVSKEIHQLS